MRLYCVRHGTTSWTDEGRYTGASNPPLTAAGEAETAATAGHMDGTTVDLAVSSPLVRCHRTYEILRPRLGGVGEEWIDERAREIYYGDWEGHTRPEVQIHEPDAFHDWDEDPTRRPPPNGESVETVVARVTELLEAMLDSGAERALLVSHRTILRILVARALGMPLSQYRRRLDHAPAALTILDLRTPTDGKLLLYNLKPRLEIGDAQS